MRRNLSRSCLNLTLGSHTEHCPEEERNEPREVFSSQIDDLLSIPLLFASNDNRVSKES
jgi:hypothetical protein